MAQYPYPENVHPDLVAKITQLRKACEEAGVPIHPYFGYRSLVEQEALWCQGRFPLAYVNKKRAVAGMAPLTDYQNQSSVTAAKPGQSRHNDSPARAVDVVLFRDGRTAEWDTGVDLDHDGVKDYEEIGRIGEALGLAWGGRWARKDWGHFELPGG